MDGYTSETAMAVAGVTATQLTYWVKSGLVQASVAAGRGRGSRRRWSFRDLVQLQVIKELMAAGASLQRVRKAMAYLRRHFPDLSHPFAELKLVTDGQSVFHLTADPGVIVDTVQHAGQAVFALAVGSIIESVRAKLEAIPLEQTRTIAVGDFEFPVTLTPDREDGGYVVRCDALPGCLSQGDTAEEALANIADAAQGWLEANAQQEALGSVGPHKLGKFRRRRAKGKVKRATAG